METKICNVCNIEKSVSDFYFRKDLNKHNNRCKRCCIDSKNMERSATHKVCKHCGVEKLFDEFQKAGGGKWMQPYCKPCDTERKRNWSIKNKNVLKEKKSRYYLEVSKQRYVPHPKVLKTQVEKKERQAIYRNLPHVKAKKSIQDKKYRENNPEKIKANRERNKQNALAQSKKRQKLMMNNIEFRVKKNLRSRIHVALKRNIKSESTMQLLGCTIDYFKFYFQFFFPNGMTWDRYIKGEIVIDHKKPCVLFDLSNSDEQKMCFHYSNLQPLWKIDNLKKGAKYQNIA